MTTIMITVNPQIKAGNAELAIKLKYFVKHPEKNCMRSRVRIPLLPQDLLDYDYEYKYQK
uniref:Uncharacterized protein n=1 Tax=Amphimedon queenslandica TaxID=400682 RepID=A0A1X7V3Y7_AMPQE